MKNYRLVVAALMGWVPVGMLPAAPQTTQGPGPRFGHAMAYDAARQVVVLFGGNSSASWPAAPTTDTWE